MRPVLLFTVAAFALMSAGLSGCGKKAEHGDEHAAEAEGHGDAHGGDAHGGSDHGAAGDVTQWSYEGDNGPGHWGDLGTENKLCKSGKRQSPVNLNGVAAPKTINLTLDYTSSAAKVQNLGYMIQVSPTDGGGIVMDKTRYALQTIQFRTPSEHTIDGHRAAMETQFVHKSEDGQTLIVSVLSDVGVADPMLAPIWTWLPTDPGPAALIPDLLVNARDLMPATEEFYAYAGSITTPPCTESVTWLVYASPLSVSPEQVDAYQRLTGPNARPIQQPQDRDILHIVGG